MSKDKAGKSAHVESHESHGSNGNGAKPAAPVVKVDAKTLFRVYQAAQDRIGAAQLALEAAMVERSNAVQAIKEALGTGPFSYRGQTVSVSSRGTKNPDGTIASTGYFFKGIGGSVQVIE